MSRSPHWITDSSDLPPALHDVRPEDVRTHELLEQILSRLPAPEDERQGEYS